MPSEGRLFKPDHETIRGGDGETFQAPARSALPLAMPARRAVPTVFVEEFDEAEEAAAMAL